MPENIKMFPEKITIQVGDRQFVTTTLTLVRSKILQPMIINDSSKDYFFLDGDPNVFHYILSYLVNNVFPLLYGSY